MATANRCSRSLWWPSLDLPCLCFLCLSPDLIPVYHVVWASWSLQCKCSKWTSNSVVKEVLLLSKTLEKQLAACLRLLTEQPIFVSKLILQLSLQPALRLCSFSYTALKERSELISRVEETLPCWRQLKTDLPLRGGRVISYVPLTCFCRKSVTWLLNHFIRQIFWGTKSLSGALRGGKSEKAKRSSETTCFFFIL